MIWVDTCWCKQNTNLCRGIYVLCPACCATPSPENTGNFPVVNMTDQRVSCCVLHVQNPEFPSSCVKPFVCKYRKLHNTHLIWSNILPIQHVWPRCSLSVLSFLSTIHGRIDQVNQLLELDYQKRGGARYTALDKWTNQLNSLNQAIVSKLTWWHVKSGDEENGMFEYIHNVCYCASSSKTLWDETHSTGFKNANELTETWEPPDVCCFVPTRGNHRHLFLFFMFPDWQIHVQHTKCFSSVKNKKIL